MARLSGRPLLDTRADAALFVDRRAELDRLDRAAAQGLNALVSGVRGIGKTSLLRHKAYGRRITGLELPVLDATALTDPAAFLASVASAVGATGRPDGQASAADLVATLSQVAPARDAALVLAVDGLSPALAQAVFGQLRDELWRAPLTWLVSCADVDEPAFLRPPADAFFDTTVRLPALSDDDIALLLRRRATVEELGDKAVAEVVRLAAGVPRRAIDLARHLLLEPGPAGGADAVAAVRDRMLDREQAVDRLGTPARMLLAELETIGGASASDERLLARLGWTRARAAQVLGELEREGLVDATDEPRASGRPRRIYHSKDWLTA
jgi:hypothetical protein